MEVSKSSNILIKDFRDYTNIVKMVDVTIDLNINLFRLSELRENEYKEFRKYVEEHIKYNEGLYKEYTTTDIEKYINVSVSAYRNMYRIYMEIILKKNIKQPQTKEVKDESTQY